MGDDDNTWTFEKGVSGIMGRMFGVPMKTRKVKSLTGQPVIETTVEKAGPVSVITVDTGAMTYWAVRGPGHFGRSYVWVQPDEATAKSFAQRLLKTLADEARKAGEAEEKAEQNQR